MSESCDAADLVGRQLGVQCGDGGKEAGSDPRIPQVPSRVSYW